MTEQSIEKVKAGKAKLNPKEYNKLVAHARLQAIRLINSKYDIKPMAVSASREDWDYNITNRLLDFHCDCDALIISGTWEYTANCNWKRKKLVTVTARYSVTYRLGSECDAEAARAFFERVGRFAAYPYFRGTFAMLTQQSGIMLHPLPMISEQPRWVTPPNPDASPPITARPTVKTRAKPKAE